ncbi:MAG: 4a-hydroxytetrahydrobiopterin dehydratase [Nitrososphaerales archaeon]
MEKPRILSREEVAERLKTLSGWSYEGKTLQKSLRFKDFKEAISFINRVAAAAEELDHHPDILLHGYNYVRLNLNTHLVGGEVTEWDFELAHAIEEM